MATSLALVAMASLAVSNYFDPIAPSSLPQLQHDNNRQRNNSTNFPLCLHLRASFVTVPTQMHRYYVISYLLRVYFENDVKCDKEAVAATSLESQPCQIQLLITDNGTTSATNITTTQREFHSRTDHAKTTDLKR